MSTLIGADVLMIVGGPRNMPVSTAIHGGHECKVTSLRTRAAVGWRLGCSLFEHNLDARLDFAPHFDIEAHIDEQPDGAAEHEEDVADVRQRVVKLRPLVGRVHSPVALP
jgi:hypothetical protein